MKQTNLMRKPFMAFIAVTSWFAIILQLYLVICSDSPYSQPTRIVNYFSFFTILGNILVTVSLTVSLLGPGSKAGRLFLSSGMIAATTLYIAFVGLGYNALLRHAWNPQGWQRVADELLHLVIPVLYIIYWLCFAPKEKHPWKIVFLWMLFPLIYLIYSMIRGALTGIYPYYFLDAGQLGYAAALSYIAVLILVFFIIALSIVGIERHFSARQARP